VFGVAGPSGQVNRDHLPRWPYTATRRPYSGS